MATAATLLPTRVMSELLWRPSGRARSLVLVVAGSIALALSAKFSVPSWPVPMTMQSLVVVLIGVAYGSRLAGATVLAYLGEGLIGLPVFAGASAGPLYMMGPTGGYLLGFLLAAVVTGWLAERRWDRSPALAAAALTIGHVVLFVPGVIWLAVLIGWPKAVALGVTPFIAGTIVKIALGTALLVGSWSAIGRRASAR